MTYTFRTLMVPASLGAKAIAITDALGYPEKGMFVAKVAEGNAPSIGTADTRPAVAWISSGAVPDNSPVLGDANALWTAVQAGTPGAVTLADCQAFVKAIDLTQADPHAQQAVIIDEVKLSTNAPAWVQPTGAHDAYAMNAAATYAGKGWRSLIDGNVWAPGVTGWRELWGASGTVDPFPAWVQPLGAQDAYPLNAQVSHNGQHWKNTGSAANVWEPGVYGWVVVA